MQMYGKKMLHIHTAHVLRYDAGMQQVGDWTFYLEPFGLPTGQHAWSNQAIFGPCVLAYLLPAVTANII